MSKVSADVLRESYIHRHPGLVPGSAGRQTTAVQIERTPCVYLLGKAYHSTLYTGVTSNLVGRIIQHREGTFDGFTRRYGIYRLVWYMAGDTMDAVIRREKQIKRWPREYKYNLIEEFNPMWNDLAVGLGLPPLRQ
jgi:putative endonuclease